MRRLRTGSSPGPAVSPELSRDFVDLAGLAPGEWLAAEGAAIDLEPADALLSSR